MSATRYIVAYWDVVAKVHYDSAGNQLKRNKWPYIIYKEQPILNVYLVTDSDLTAFTDLDDTLVYSAAIDYNYDHADELMCKTLDANINKSGDWIQDSAGDADPTQGEFSIRLDANNSNYQTKIGSVKEKFNSKLEIIGADASGNVVFVTQMDFRTLNIIDDDGSTPAEIAFAAFMEEYTDAGTGKKCLRLLNSDGETLATFTPPGV
jgi:hypothetical protein